MHGTSTRPSRWNAPSTLLKQMYGGFGAMWAPFRSGGGQGLRRPRCPERPARRRQLSLGHEVQARKDVFNSGPYRQVVPNKKIKSTMSFSNENGQAVPGAQVSVPGKWPDAIVVLVEFSESERKTRVSVRETGVPLITYPMIKIGWAQQFEHGRTLAGVSPAVSRSQRTKRSATA